MVSNTTSVTEGMERKEISRVRLVIMITKIEKGKVNEGETVKAKGEFRTASWKEKEGEMWTKHLKQSQHLEVEEGRPPTSGPLLFSGRTYSEAKGK